MSIVLVIAILFVVFYIGVELYGKPLFAFFAKALASIGFVWLGLYHVTLGNDPVIFLIIAGLVSGLLGDLILALRPLRPKEEDETIIIGGIVAFSIGHLFYLSFLLHDYSISLLSVLFSLGMTGVVILSSYLMKFKMGKTKIPSYIYSALIFLMIGQTISLLIENPSNPFAVILIFGAILFGISDLILAPIYYKGMNTKVMITLNLVTYYGAQILIAYSLIFL